MKRGTWFGIIVAVGLLSASLVAWAQSSRVTEAELRLVQKQEQREREKLDQQWAVIMHPADLVAEQKRWESATDKVCQATSQSIEHQIKASRCKAQRYRIRRSHLLEIGTN